MKAPDTNRTNGFPDDGHSATPTTHALRLLHDCGQWVALFGHQSPDALQAQALRDIGGRIAAATQVLMDELRRRGHLVVCCLLLATCVSDQALPVPMPLSWLTAVLEPSLRLQPWGYIDW